MAFVIPSGFAITACTPKYTVPLESAVSGVHTRRLALNAAGFDAYAALPKNAARTAVCALGVSSPFVHSSVPPAPGK